MPLPKLHEVLADPAYSSAPVSRQKEISNAYWKAHAAENPEDEWGQAQAADMTSALDVKEKLESAAPLERRALEFQKKSLDSRVRTRIADSEGMFSSPEERKGFLEKTNSELEAERARLGKTFSLFKPEVAKEMEPTWNALDRYASDSGYFGGEGGLKGAATVAADVATFGAFSEKAAEDKVKYEKLRDTVSKDFNLAPEEVDDVMRHRLNKFEGEVSRDAFGTLHFKDSALVKNVDEIEDIVSKSNLPEAVKAKAKDEAPQRVALFKEGVVQTAKQNFPELAEELGLGDDINENYRKIVDATNKSRTAQAASGAGQYALGRGETVMKASSGMAGLAPGFGGATFTAPPNLTPEQKAEFEQSIATPRRISEGITALSDKIQQDKVRIFGTDAATVGQGGASVLESVGLVALTGGAGNLIKAERIANAGKVGAAVLKSVKAGLTIAPTGAIYGGEQALDTWERASQSDDPAIRARAGELAAKSFLSEFGVTTGMSMIGLGGVEGMGKALASKAAREAFAKSASAAVLRVADNFALSPISEAFEESLIVAIDSIHVQQQLNPDMTDEDVRKAIGDTIIATAFAAGGVAATKGTVDLTTDIKNLTTQDKTTQELHDTADELYKTAAQEVVPQGETEAGAITPPSDAGMAPVEQGAEVSEPVFSDTSVVMPGDSDIAAEYEAAMVEEIIDVPEDLTITELKTIHYSREPFTLNSDFRTTDTHGGYGEESTFGKGLYLMEPSDEKGWTEMESMDLGTYRNEIVINPKNPLMITPEKLKTQGFDKIESQIKSGEHDAVVVRGFNGFDIDNTQTRISKRIRELWSPVFPEGKTSGKFLNGAEYDSAKDQAILEITGIKPKDWEAFNRAGYGQNQVFIPEGKIASVTSPTPTATQQSPAQAETPTTETLPADEKTSPEGKGEVASDNEVENVSVASEKTQSIIERTAPGEERIAAMAKRKEAAVAVAKTIKKGDKIVTADGEVLVAQQDANPKNGEVLFEGFSEPVEAAAYLTPDIVTINGVRQELDAGKLERGTAQPSAQPSAQKAPAAAQSEQKVAQTKPIKLSGFKASEQSTNRDLIIESLGEPTESGVVETDSGVKVEMHPFEDGVELRAIQNLNGTKGAASETLDRITEEADTLGTKLYLYPKPFGTGERMSKAQLVAWYERKGFVMSKDGETMVRTPKETKPAQQPKAEEVKTDKSIDTEADVASEETVRAVNNAVLEAFGLTPEEAQEITGEDLGKPEPISEENPTGPKMDKNGQLELFQEPEPEAPNDPAVGRFLRENTEPDESTSGLLEDAGEVLFNDVRQSSLSRTGQRVAKLADELIQNNINKSGNVTVGLVKMYGFLAKVWSMKNRRTPGWTSFLKPQQVANRASILAHEIATSIAKKGSGVDWYRGKIDEMYATLSKFYPELREAGEARFIFSTILAITSNGENVFNNMNLAVKLYDIVRGQGRMPNESDTSNIAAREKAMFKGFDTVQRQIEKDGWATVDADFKKETSYGDMKKKYGVNKSDEASDVEVSNAYVLGAKIGAFWGNLNGNFKHIAMDLWFTRTMSRLAGDFRTINPSNLKKYARILSTSDGVPQDVKDELTTFIQDIIPGESNWTSVPTEIREKLPTAYAWLKQTASRYASRKDPETGKSFFQGTYTEVQSKKFIEALDKNTNAPKNADHRQWMRDVLNEAKRQLAEAGIDLSLAEMQAVMWFHEKDLYTKFGATSKMGERADFAQAAENTMSGRTQFRGDAGPRAEDVDQDLFSREVDAEASREAKKKLIAGRAEQIKEIRGKKGVRTLRQDTAGPKGQVTFKGLSEAFIQYLKSSDGSTAVHEPIHVARRFLLNRNIPADKRFGITDDMIDAANEFVGATDSNWTVEQEEKFARAFERYLWEGAETGNAKVDTIFSKIRDLLRKVYNTIEGTSLDVELTPEIRELFGKLITRGETLKAQGAKPTAIPLKVSVEGKAPKPKAEAAPKPAAKPKAKPLPPKRRPTENVDDYGVRKQIDQSIRSQYGFKDAKDFVGATDQAAWDEALRRVAQNAAWDKMTSEERRGKQAPPPVGEALVTELGLRQKPADKIEIALLAHEGLQREQAIENIVDKINRLPDNSRKEADKLHADLAVALREFEAVLNLTRIQGSNAGLALQAMKLVVSRQYERSRMLERAKGWRNKNSTKKQDLSPGEVREVTEMSERINKLMKEREAIQAELEKAQGLAEENAILKKMIEEAGKKKAPAVRKAPSRIVEVANGARERLRALGLGRAQNGEIVLEQRGESETELDQAFNQWIVTSSDISLHATDILQGVRPPSSLSGRKKRRAAALILNALANAPKNKVSLYRGSTGSGNGIDSWTSNEKTAKYHAEKSGGKVVTAPTGSVTALPIPNSPESEYIVSGVPITDATRVLLVREVSDIGETTTLNQDPEVEIIEDLAIIGMLYLTQGAKTVEAFKAKLNAEFGTEFDYAIVDIFNQAQANLRAENAKIKQKTPQELAALVDPAKPLSDKLVYNMAKGFVEEGLRGEAVLDAVTELLRDDYPKITREEVVVAFTGYGKVKHPSKEEVNVTLRELRAVERLGAQLDSIAKGEMPKRTGLQRDKPTAVVRDLLKKVKDSLRAAGFKHNDKADRLGGSLDAFKTRLENEINDLNAAVRRGTRIDRPRRAPETDTVLEGLKKKRDAAKKLYDETFGINRRQMSDEQRLRNIQKTLAKKIAEEEAVARGEVRKPKEKKARLDNATTKAQRERLEVLRESNREMLEALNPKKTSAQKAIERLERGAQKSIERFEYFIKNGEFPPKPDGSGYTRADLPVELQKLVASLRDTVREMQKDQRILTPPEELARRRAVKHLTKTIADLEARIEKRDYSRKPRVESTDPEVRGLRETVKNLRKVLDDIRKDDLKPIDPEEKRIQRLIKASQTRTAKLRAKIAAQDFRKETKVEPRKDERLTKVKIEEAKAMEEFNALRKKWEKENLKGFEKAWDMAAQILQLRKIVVLGVELGVVLRQGYLFSLRFATNPVQVFDALGQSFLAAFSRDMEIKAYQAVMDHPLAVWDKEGSKMVFHSPFDEGFRNMEDISDPELLNKLAKVWGIKIPANLILGVERFTRTFQNVSRRSLQQSMVTAFTKHGEPNKNDMAVFNNAVMNATGRGSFKNQQIDSGVALANMITISMRWAISRAKVLSLEPLWTSHGKADGVSTRRARATVAHELYAKALFGRAVLTAVAYGLSQGFGDDDEKEMELDPTSPNFMKFRFKGTGFDITGGMRPYVNLISRLAMGYRKNGKGEIVPIVGEDANPFTGDTDTEVWRFIRNRANINLGLALDAIKRKTYDGDQMTLGIFSEQLLYPIMVQDTIDIFREHGPVEGLAVWNMMFFGAAVQVEKEPEPKKSRIPDSFF
jgi:hypothetical protein